MPTTTSATHYNYFRDYDPATGRYAESDPLGLYGGIGTYSYVSNDPLTNADPFGLWGPAESAVERAVAQAVSGASRAGGPTNPVGAVATVIAVIAVTEAIHQDRLNRLGKPDREAYRRVCDEPPPPCLTGCDLIRWQIERVRRCIHMRVAYMIKWNDTYRGHYDQIGERQRNLKKLEAALAACKDEPLP